ncbi:MAG: hypothetical protein E7163_03310 [Firmicutes bacterium]|nr:hypothetical protein [Bacillota bacterium]
MPKIRTLSSAINELKNIDPNCSLTLTALRRKIRNNELPYAKVGNKYLVDLDIIVKILFNDNKELEQKNETN